MIQNKDKTSVLEIPNIKSAGGAEVADRFEIWDRVIIQLCEGKSGFVPGELRVV
jgi:hypothetical protein